MLEEGIDNMVAANTATNQAVKHGDRRHAASIAKQRKQADTDAAVADATAKVVAKRVADQQPMPAWIMANLPADNEPTPDDWSATLPHDEMPALPEASPVPEPVPEPEPTPAVADDAAPEASEADPGDDWPRPSWRDHNAPLTHHLEWIDSEGCQHGLTIRCDDIDDLVRQMTTVKALIASAKHKASQNAPEAPAPPSAPVAEEESSRRCELHNSAMFRRLSRKTGRPYSAHRLESGELCFGR